MGELEPIAAEAVQSAPEAALVRELRTLFEGLGVSQNRYAARVYLDKSVLSRYLSGERIPRWDFVRQLLVESTMKRDGVPPTPEVVKHLRSLHHAALEASGSTAHKLQLLQEQLAEADAQAQRADRRENELEQALQDVQRRAADLEVRCRELEDSLDRQHGEHSRALLALRDETDAERAALLAEIERLTHELELAQQRRAAAEARCEELERQLEADATAGVANSAPQGKPDGERRTTELPEGISAAEMSVLAARIGQVSPEKAAMALADMPQPWAAAILRSMQTDSLKDLVAGVSAERAARILWLLEPEQVAALLRGLPRVDVMSVVRETNPEIVAAALDHMNVTTLRGVFATLATHLATEVLELLRPARAAEALRGLPPYAAAKLLEYLEPSRARQIVEALSSYDAAEILQHLDPEMRGRMGLPQPK